MNDFKAFVNKHQEKLKYFFLASAALSCFNCLAKPDYNLVLYAYAFFVWNMMGQSSNDTQGEKIYCFFFMLATLLIDIFWVLFWGSMWNDLKHDEESSIHFLVILFSWISIGIKGASIIMVGIGEWASIRSSLPAKLQEQLNANYKEQVDEENEKA